MDIIIVALIALPILVVLELVWFRIMSTPFYRVELASVLRSEVNQIGTMAFYTMYPLAVAYFVVVPAIAAGSFFHALTVGAVFGFVCYATCEFTNLAMVKGWTKKVVLVNLLWGIATTGFSSAATYYIATSIFGL